MLQDVPHLLLPRWVLRLCGLRTPKTTLCGSTWRLFRNLHLHCISPVICEDSKANRNFWCNACPDPKADFVGRIILERCCICQFNLTLWFSVTKPCNYAWISLTDVCPLLCNSFISDDVFGCDNRLHFGSCFPCNWF